MRVCLQKLISICEKSELNGAQMIGLLVHTQKSLGIRLQSKKPYTSYDKPFRRSDLWVGLWLRKWISSKKNNIFDGQVMIVGAAGSIGKVNSKILVKNGESVISSPTLYKLIDLKGSLKRLIKVVK